MHTNSSCLLKLMVSALLVLPFSLGTVRMLPAESLSAQQTSTFTPALQPPHRADQTLTTHSWLRGISPNQNGHAAVSIPQDEPTPDQWAVKLVDGSGEVGATVDVQVDPSGSVHCCYQTTGHNALWYALLDDAGVQREIIDAEGLPGYDLCLEQDDSRTLHVIHRDRATHSVKYLKQVGREWLQETCIPSLSQPERCVDLAATESGVVVAYTGGDVLNSKLMLAVSTADSWEQLTVDPDSGSGWFPAVTLSPSMNLGIAYLNKLTESLYWATPRGDAWYRKTVKAGNVEGWISAQGLDHATRLCFKGREGLWYGCSQSESCWATELIDERPGVGLSASLALDPGDQPGVVYLDEETRSLHLAERIAGEWRLSRVKASEASKEITGCALAYDPVSRPTIVYVENGRLYSMSRINPYLTLMPTLNKNEYGPGQILILKLVLDSVEEFLLADLYLALELTTGYYYFPSWTQELTSQTIMLRGAHRHILTILTVVLPELGVAYQEGVFWAVVCATGTTTQISNLSKVAFRYER